MPTFPSFLLHNPNPFLCQFRQGRPLRREPSYRAVIRPVVLAHPFSTSSPSSLSFLKLTSARFFVFSLLCQPLLSNFLESDVEIMNQSLSRLV